MVAALPVLACFALLPGAQAVNPAPDGCYPNFTTAEGCNALNLLTTGSGNTGLGWFALFSDSAGSFNTAVGGGALTLNNADSNTAVGAAALLLNTSGTENTAVGTDALVFNDSGSGDTAIGFFALRANVNGMSNTAVGAGAMESADGGSDNTAIGELAGNNITGNSNTCLGSSAGSNLTTGEGNIYIGAQVQAGGSGEFEIIRIGNDGAFAFHYDTYIAGIWGRPVGPAPLTVMCGSDGKLSANASSRRFKHDIKPIDKASEAILALKPVSFRYNNDSTNTAWFGLIAEDVAQVSEDLIVRDKEGKPFGVRYEEVNAMLLNEFLKEHRKGEKQARKIQQQEATIAELKKDFQSRFAQQERQIETLESGLQKVIAQVELNRPAAKLAGDDQ